MLALLAHLGTVFYYVYVLAHMSNIDVTKYNNKALQDFGDFFGKYFTIWCFIIQTALFSVCLAYDVIRLIFPTSKLKQLLYDTKNFVLVSLAAPVSVAVTLFFWTIWNIDRELVMPPALDKIIPMWLNHCLHTIPSLLVLLELLAGKHEVPSLRHSCLAVGILGASYTYVLFNEYAQSGRWLYPIFGVIGWPARISLIVAFTGLIFLFMGLFRKVVRITSPEEHLVKKHR